MCIITPLSPQLVRRFASTKRGIAPAGRLPSTDTWVSNDATTYRQGLYWRESAEDGGN